MGFFLLQIIVPIFMLLISGTLIILSTIVVIVSFLKKRVVSNDMIVQSIFSIIFGIILLLGSIFFLKETYNYIKEYYAFSDFAKNEINYSDISKIEILDNVHSGNYYEKKTIHTIEDTVFIREIVNSLKTISIYSEKKGGANSYILIMHKKDSSKIYFLVRYNSPTMIGRIKVYENGKYIKYDYTSNKYKISFPSKAKLFGTINTETPPK